MMNQDKLTATVNSMKAYFKEEGLEFIIAVCSPEGEVSNMSVNMSDDNWREAMRELAKGDDASPKSDLQHPELLPAMQAMRAVYDEFLLVGISKEGEPHYVGEIGIANLVHSLVKLGKMAKKVIEAEL